MLQKPVLKVGCGESESGTVAWWSVVRHWGIGWRLLVAKCCTDGNNSIVELRHCVNGFVKINKFVKKQNPVLLRLQCERVAKHARNTAHMEDTVKGTTARREGNSFIS